LVPTLYCRRALVSAPVFLWGLTVHAPWIIDWSNPSSPGRHVHILLGIHLQIRVLAGVYLALRTLYALEASYFITVVVLIGEGSVDCHRPLASKVGIFLREIFGNLVAHLIACNYAISNQETCVGCFATPFSYASFATFVVCCRLTCHSRLPGSPVPFPHNPFYSTTTVHARSTLRAGLVSRACLPTGT